MAAMREYASPLPPPSPPPPPLRLALTNERRLKQLLTLQQQELPPPLGLQVSEVSNMAAVRENASFRDHRHHCDWH